MAKKTVNMPQAQYSGLNFENLMADIHNLVKENQNYNSSWDDFLNSNAGRLLTEMFAWIADQLATRIDVVANENFIGTAQFKKSQMRLLKLIGYRFQLPVSAAVQVDITFNRGIGYYTITPEYEEGTGIYSPKRIKATNKDGGISYFEAISYDQVNDKFSYKVPIKIDTSKSNQVTFYEGTTYVESFISSEVEGQVFSLGNSPVCRNSIEVYMVTRDGDVITETICGEVDNFLATKAQQASTGTTNNPIPYVVNVLDGDAVEIEFGDSVLLPSSDRRIQKGTEIRVFYRVGGGIIGNVTKGSISIDEKVPFGAENIIASYRNYAAGIGGEDTETIDHATYYAPLKLRTANKTVTADDYDIVLQSHTNILNSKSYGETNMPSNFYNTYGLFLNPMEVWNYIIVKKPGWEEYEPSKYNEANFGTFNLENEFNGKYAFKDGQFGIPLTFSKFSNNEIMKYSGDVNYDGNGNTTFRNYCILKTKNDRFKSKDFYIYDEATDTYNVNEDLIITLSKTKYDKYKHLKFEDIPKDFFSFKEFTGDPILLEQKTPIHAFLEGKRDLSSGLNTNTYKHLVLALDGKKEVIVDFSGRGAIFMDDLNGNPGIVSIINSTLANAYGSDKAYQDMGLILPESVLDLDVPNLENKDEEDWYIQISGVQYIVNTGLTQTYRDILGYMNTTLNPYGYECEFVKSSINISCYDIRVKTTHEDGWVELQEALTGRDLLVALEAFPLSTQPVSGGDYSEVASKVVTDNGLILLKLTSPNTGDKSTLTVRKSTLNNGLNDATGILLGYDYSDTNEEDKYECFGNRSIYFITRNPSETDFGDLVYENGSVGYEHDFNFDIFLNYTSTNIDRITLGTYYNENFNQSSDIQWKRPTKRIYNTIYTLDPDDPLEKKEYLDMSRSKFVVKFTHDKIKKNSIFKVNNTYEIAESGEPSIESKEIDELDFLSERNSLKISVSGKPFKILDLSNCTTFEHLQAIFNANFAQDANFGNPFAEKSPINFCELDNEDMPRRIILTASKKDNGGNIIIYKQNNPLDCSADFFSELEDVEVGGEYVIYPSGDYYIEYNESKDMMDMVLLNKPKNNFPDLPFYTHFVQDRRWVPLDTSIAKEATDEDDFNSYMQNYKIAGIENTFKKPLFLTFDVSGTVYVNTQFPLAQIKSNVENALRKQFNLENTGFGEDIIKSQIMGTIIGVSGVRYVEIDYFGQDATKPETNCSNRINANFDEIVVLCEDIVDDEGNKIHGIIFNYTVL